MPIISVKEVTPRNIRAVVPDKYKSMPYMALAKGDKVTINSCVFSVYPAKGKDGNVLRVQNGDNAGKVVTNITIYFGLDSGHYTSLKNDVVLGQMSALTGFDDSSDVGYYPFDFEPETVEVITVDVPMGKGDAKKNVPVLAFRQ